MKPSELIATPDKWCKGIAAIDSAGDAVSPSSPSACKWCAIGSIYKCVNADDRTEAFNRIRTILAARGRIPTIALFNDTHEHAEVVALLQEAGY